MTLPENMTHNSFGTIFKYTSFGESHGSHIGCVIDGVPAGIEINIQNDIQKYLDERKPGNSEYVTQRVEDDKAQVISGLLHEGDSNIGTTTGAPICILIPNKDSNEKDYQHLKDIYRPGHADLVYEQKYGLREWRGSGRASARETASRVAAGAIARKILPQNTQIYGYIKELGGIKIDENNFDRSQIKKNKLYCPDILTLPKWEEYLKALIEEGDSCGAIIEIRVINPPISIGEPVYQRLDSELARALMSINAVKAVEIGAGFDSARAKGSQFQDEMMYKDGKLNYLSNNSGGIVGGIATGQDIIARFAVKPASSIKKPLQTIDRVGNNIQHQTMGRHDPCVGIRAVSVGEAMVACVLADLYLISKLRKI